MEKLIELVGLYPELFAVLVGFVTVFISDFIGNNIAFGHRFVNAIVTGTVFAVIYGLVVLWISSQLPPTTDTNPVWVLVLLGFAVVVVADLIGNAISFRSRFVNALVTATVFAIIFGGIIIARSYYLVAA